MLLTRLNSEILLVQQVCGGSVLMTYKACVDCCFILPGQNIPRLCKILRMVLILLSSDIFQRFKKELWTPCSNTSKKMSDSNPIISCRSYPGLVWSHAIHLKFPSGVIITAKCFKWLLEPKRNFHFSSGLHQRLCWKWALAQMTMTTTTMMTTSGIL